MHDRVEYARENWYVLCVCVCVEYSIRMEESNRNINWGRAGIKWVRAENPNKFPKMTKMCLLFRRNWVRTNKKKEEKKIQRNEWTK